MVPAEPDADFMPPDSDPLRSATPVVDDVEARRARASIEAQLFGGASQPVTVGRYRILGRIGSGGMGVVYRAHDPELARDVAVKLLNPESASGSDAETASARLVREARAMARLAHPNVIHVYDVGTVEDGVFVAMELVEGDDLSSWISKESRDWRDVLRRCIDAGAGLAAAHAAGLVHRDFKPENVLVGNDDRVRVVDFGLAGGTANLDVLDSGEVPVDADGEPIVTNEALSGSLTKTGVMLGTPKYMAPEQFGGAATSNARSDQFSFCVTVFEALYGYAPFVGDNVREYRRNAQAGRVRSAPVDTRVDPWIYDELARGMAVDPAQRHRGLETLLNRLRRALETPAPSRRRWIVPIAASLLAAVGAFALLGQPKRAVSEPTLLTSKAPEPGAAAPAPRPLPAPEPEPDPSAPPVSAPVAVTQPAPEAKPKPEYEENCYVQEDKLHPLRKTRHKPKRKTNLIRDDRSRCIRCRAAEHQPPSGVQDRECRAWYRCRKVDESECTSIGI